MNLFARVPRLRGVLTIWDYLVSPEHLLSRQKARQKVISVYSLAAIFRAR
jgi:hypothetical protein